MRADVTGDDGRYDGLDDDERAAARATEEQIRSPSSGDAARRRVIGILAFFVVAFVPLVLFGTWLTTTFVYEPLCDRDGVEVTSIEQYSPSLTTGTQLAACGYSDGTEQPLGDVIGGGWAFAVSTLVNVVRFGLPFIVVGVVLWVLPSRSRRI